MSDWNWIGLLSMAGEWAIAAAIVYEGRQAISAFRHTRLHDTFTMLEDESGREARFRIFNDIAPKQEAKEQWWVDKDLHKAASKVAGCYDQIGLRMNLDKMSFDKLSSPDREILLWLGESVVRSHEILESFLQWRREVAPRSYAGYTDLYRIAKAAIETSSVEARN